jgi:hypothetical protein
VRGSRRSWPLVAAAMFVSGWGGNQFTPLLLLYRNQGHYSTVVVDAFLGAYVFGLAPGLLVGGPASDRYGRRIVWPGVVLSAVASGVLALGAVSTAALYAGRFLTGIAVGLAMAVGTSWLKELSQPPYDPAADHGSGARRASLALTGGFGLGAGVAGALAQWGPWPMVLPYLVHIVVTIPVCVLLLRVPETRPRSALRSSFVSDLTVPAAAHRRFRRVVVPAAPWIFGSAGIAYAVLPGLVGARIGSYSLAYATLLTVATLGTGAAVQPLARRLDSVSTARALVVAMAVMAVGVAAATVSAAVTSPLLALGAAMVLGAGYGIALVSGLLEIQRIAGPDDLAGLTAVFYALTYLGFLLPVLLATLTRWASVTTLLAALTGLSLASLAVVAGASRRYLPVRVPATTPREAVHR